VRALREHGFEEGASTRLLVYAAQLVSQGIDIQRACEVAISRAITDDREVQRAVAELVTTIFP
jgi:nitric oxide reductase NorQ protein